jgi:hypothetical protein
MPVKKRRKERNVKEGGEKGYSQKVEIKRGRERDVYSVFTQKRSVMDTLLGKTKQALPTPRIRSKSPSPPLGMALSLQRSMRAAIPTLPRLTSPSRLFEYFLGIIGDSVQHNGGLDHSSVA